MAFFDGLRKLFRNDVNLNDTSVELDDVLLKALLNGETITREKALMLPVVSSAVDFISNAVASMPVRLFRVVKGEVHEVENDIRTRLLNNDTGDTLDAFQMKKAMVTDYLLGKGGYAVIQKDRNNVVALRYVEDIYVSVYQNADPVYKYVTFLIGNRDYKNYEVIKLLRNTKNGASGTGLTDEISKALETAYSTLLYQLGLVQSGGNKKGFLTSEKKLDQESIDKLKEAWRNLYANNTSNVVVLNNGLKFQESSSTSVEMQLNDSKKTLKDEINGVFHIFDDFDKTFKEAIYPIIKAFETALNSTLLLESEKKKYFFEFDVKEIIRANLKERYEAYKLAKETGFLTINEIRREENLNYVEGLDVINVGLGAVLYDTNTHTYYTPNTGSTFGGDAVNENNINEDENLEKGADE
jgi:HK97 family phage portal protein